MRRLGGLWAHPDFVRLWGAATVSVFGTLVTRTALPFTAILVLGATPSAIALLAIAELLPGFLVGLVAGAWVDRLRRRPIMIAADLGRAVLLATIPLAALLGVLSLPQLYLVALGTSLLSVFFDVAYLSYLPTLVEREELVEGNSKLTAAQSVAEFAAFAAGGWLVQLLTAPIAILVDAFSFVWSALLVGRIRAAEPPAGRGADPPEAESPDGMGAEIVEGLRALRSHPILLALAGGNTGLNLGSQIVGTVFLLYVNQELGFDPGVLGFVFAIGGLTSLLGALIAGRVLGLGLGPVMIATLALVAVGQALVPVAADASLAAVALLVAQQLIADPAWTVYDIGQVSLRQAITPGRLLGRVNASVRVLEAGAMLVGALLGGWLGERIGLRPTLVVGAGVVMLAAVGLLLSPVRRVRRTPEPGPSGGVPESAPA